MTSTMNTNNTSSGQPKPGVGAKIKGAAQIVHGLGDNVRGTLLGGVDTLLHQDSSANDAIAQKGRAEHARGVARKTGGPLAAEYYSTPAEENSVTGHGVGQAAGQTNPATRTSVPQTQPQVGAYSAAPAYASHAPVPGTGPPAQNPRTDADAYPTKQQGYGATDTMNSQPHQGAPGAPIDAGTQDAPYDPAAAQGNTGTGGAHTYPPSQLSASALNDPYYDHDAVAQRIPAYDGPGNADMPHRERHAGHTEPQHHRGDAIDAGLATGGGPAQGGGGGVPPAYMSVAGGPPADVGAQHRGEEML
ncbi:hypothetical protein FB451DRAFT_1491523 [Mycena latifolia]|nr:hypothetical protein FB451DRAFT_1491523 [Mycena latifolia]